MVINYTKEQLKNIFESLPEELKEIIVSEESAENIFNTCADQGLNYSQIPKVARLAGRVLMGLIPVEEFQEEVEKELKLNKDGAKELSRGINKLVFYPVKEWLAKISKITISKGEKEEPEIEGLKSEELIKTEEKSKEEEKTTNSDPDTYRESVN